MNEALPHKIFEGNTLRKRVLRKMLELSDGVTVEERPKGRSVITFRDAGNAYGYDSLWSIRYDQVTVMSILDMLRAFGRPIGEIQHVIAKFYGVEE